MNIIPASPVAAVFDIQEVVSYAYVLLANMEYFASIVSIYNISEKVILKIFYNLMFKITSL